MSLNIDKDLIATRIKEKSEKYQEQGFADKEFRKEIKGKRVVMALPNNVYEQQKLLLMAESVMVNNLSFYESFDLEKKFYEEISKNILIDNNPLSSMLGMKDYELPQLQSYSMLYYIELLAPLSQWRDIVAKEILT